MGSSTLETIGSDQSHQKKKSTKTCNTTTDIRALASCCNKQYLHGKIFSFQINNFLLHPGFGEIFADLSASKQEVFSFSPLYTDTGQAGYSPGGRRGKSGKAAGDQRFWHLPGRSVTRRSDPTCHWPTHPAQITGRSFCCREDGQLARPAVGYSLQPPTLR